MLYASDSRPPTELLSFIIYRVFQSPKSYAPSLRFQVRFSPTQRIVNKFSLKILSWLKSRVRFTGEVAFSHNYDYSNVLVGLGKFLANDILTTSIILYRVLRSEPAK